MSANHRTALGLKSCGGIPASSDPGRGQEEIAYLILTVVTQRKISRLGWDEADTWESLHTKNMKAGCHWNRYE